jgi:hypothetical protein
MSSDFRVEYHNRSIQLAHLDVRLRTVASPNWNVRLSESRIVEVPTTVRGLEFAKEHPQWFPHRDPGQIVVEDTALGERIYIQGRIDPESDVASFLVSYTQQEARLAVLKMVLRVLLLDDKSWLRWVNGTTMLAHGPEWVEQVERDLNWYWGYDVNRAPGAPFLLSENIRTLG